MTDPDTVATSLLADIDAFARLLEEETALLNAGRAREAMALEAKKLDRMEAQAASSRALRDALGESGALAADLRAALVAAQERLAALSAENQAALARMRGASDRLLSLIVETVKAHARTGAVGYGHLAATGPQRGAASLSLAYDRRL